MKVGETKKSGRYASPDFFCRNKRGDIEPPHNSHCTATPSIFGLFQPFFALFDALIYGDIGEHFLKLWGHDALKYQ